MICALCLWSLTACLTTTDMDELESIPLQKTETKTMYHKDLGYHFKYQRSHNSVPTQVPSDIRMILLDSKYKTVDYFFWLKFNKWFKKLKFENGIMAMNQNETLDCDNFAMLYKSLFSVSSYKSKSKTEPAVGIAVVKQIEAFGGIPIGGLHMVNIIFASKGFYILEPQTGEFIELHKYPNQKHIQYIIL
jgi:hypothetical protein